jgi:hypothetical protein
MLIAAAPVLTCSLLGAALASAAVPVGEAARTGRSSREEKPMRRRAKPAKAKVEAKTTVARKSPKDDGATVRDLEKRLAETLGQLQSRDRELAEARGQLTAAHGQVSESHERQTATSEILRVISSSRTDAQPVMNAVAQSAARLCDAYDVVIRLKEGIGSVSVRSGDIGNNLVRRHG